MAQNVTFTGGTNTKGHATTQGVTKGPSASDRCSAPKQDNLTTVRIVDASQAKHSQGHRA